MTNNTSGPVGPRRRQPNATNAGNTTANPAANTARTTPSAGVQPRRRGGATGAATTAATPASSSTGSAPARSEVHSKPVQSMPPAATTSGQPTQVMPQAAPSSTAAATATTPAFAGQPGPGAGAAPAEPRDNKVMGVGIAGLLLVVAILACIFFVPWFEGEFLENKMRYVANNADGSGYYGVFIAVVVLIYGACATVQLIKRPQGKALGVVSLIISIVMTLLLGSTLFLHVSEDAFLEQGPVDVTIGFWISVIAGLASIAVAIVGLVVSKKGNAGPGTLPGDMAPDIPAPLSPHQPMMPGQ